MNFWTFLAIDLHLNSRCASKISSLNVGQPFQKRRRGANVVRPEKGISLRVATSMARHLSNSLPPRCRASVCIWVIGGKVSSVLTSDKVIDAINEQIGY